MSLHLTTPPPENIMSAEVAAAELGTRLEKRMHNRVRLPREGWLDMARTSLGICQDLGLLRNVEPIPSEKPRYRIFSHGDYRHPGQQEEPIWLPQIWHDTLGYQTVSAQGVVCDPPLAMTLNQAIAALSKAHSVYLLLPVLDPSTDPASLIVTAGRGVMADRKAEAMVGH